MPSYHAPVEDVMFLLRDVLGWERYGNLSGFADADLETVEAIIGEAAKLSEEVLQPLNQSGDKEGCTWNAGAVSTPSGFKDAYRQYTDGGWVGVSAREPHGGMGLPATVNSIVGEFTSSANLAFGMYPGLSQGAYAAIDTHASDEIKAMYCPKLATGEWTGTMNLTEPHCGTDLGLLKSKAVPNGDGSYAISGTKIWISAGEHDMADNVVHLVLARIEGAPEGTKGITLFVVPKFLPDADGNPGERNGVECAGLEHKMGIHGNATCVMSYDGAKGWIVGEENKGLNAMFVMMNEARLAVGIQGLALSEVAYQNAVDWAHDRLQGRSLTGVKNPDGPADPIIVHPDVRRMLLDVRSFNEAARALMLWTSIQSDVAHRSEDETERTVADDFLGLMTPIVKGVLTDRGFENTVTAQQVYGGTGFTVDGAVEQFVRDCRITMIYEGANGIQALDLVGRKLARNGGRAVMAFFKEVDEELAKHEGDAAMAPFCDALKAARKDLETATMWFMQNAMANPDNAGAGSTDYMHLFGLVALGLMWVRIAKAAQARLENGANGDASRMQAKLDVGRYFIQRKMPETALRLTRIQAGGDAIMAMPAEAF